jgi:hypothetical protein
MKRMLAILVGITVPVIVFASVVSFAQQPQQTADLPVVVQGRIFQGPEGVGPPPPPGNTFIFVASEMGFGGKLVKGAPYSAEAVTESIQTLSDGNRIVNRTTSTLYRDSEGRTRREQTLKAIGAFANGGEPVQTIFINDPVAGVSYALDTRTHVAHKNSPLKLERKIIAGGAAPAGAPPGGAAPKPDQHRFEYKIETKRGGAVVAPDGPLPSPRGQVILRTEQGAIGYTFKTVEDKKKVVQESLGRQLIEGVEAEGTRTTLTIPADEIGNERDILITTERWYSPELQVVVMSKHSDPRSGETIYRLTNINRTEPAKTLFELPAGYTVSEGHPGIVSPAPLPAKVRKPTNPE